LFKVDQKGAPHTRAGAAVYPIPANAASVFQHVAVAALAGMVIAIIKPLRRFFAVIGRTFLLSTLYWFFLASFLLARW